MFHSFHLAAQNGRGTFWFLPRKYFDPNLTTIYCEKQWTELHIMEFYSFYCVYYVYYLQFYTLFPAFEAGWHSRGQRLNFAEFYVQAGWLEISTLIDFNSVY